MKSFDYYTGAFKKYATFTGRAHRPEFWYFVLYNFIISLLLGLISQNLGNIYSLLVLIPSLALGARRLHDVGKSGWMQLVGLIPIIGWIWLIVLFAQKGDAEENKYGAPVPTLKTTGDNTEKESFGEKVDAFTDKAKDLGEKVTDKVEDFSEKVEEKARDIIEDIKE